MKPKLKEKALSLVWQYSDRTPCELCAKGQKTGRWVLEVKDENKTTRLSLCTRHAERLMFQLDEVLYPRAAKHLMAPRKPFLMEKL